VRSYALAAELDAARHARALAAYESYTARVEIREAARERRRGGGLMSDTAVASDWAQTAAIVSANAKGGGFGLGAEGGGAVGRGGRPARRARANVSYCECVTARACFGAGVPACPV